MDPSSYPPTSLPDNLQLHLVQAAKDWSIAHGLAVRLPAHLEHASAATDSVKDSNASASATAAPITLFPSPFPRTCFEKALELQTAYNELYAAIAGDEEWLEEIVKELIDIDDFVAKLWHIHLAVKKDGYAQDVSLGIFRSDYMCHVKKDEPETRPVIKQVEFNTIASSFGGLSEKVSSLHRYLARTNLYVDILDENFEIENLPPNDSILMIADGLAMAHQAYAASTPSNYTCILFIVQEPESNIFDQRHIEYCLFENYGIHSFRVSLQRVLDDTCLTEDRVLMYSPFQMQSFTTGSSPPAPSPPSVLPYEVSTVYFRAGYSPAEYTDREWDARLHIERSAAIKCPSILTHLAGCKKVQQVLAMLDSPHLAHFLPNEEKARRVRETFVPMYPMEPDYDVGDPQQQQQQQQQQLRPKSTPASSLSSSPTNAAAHGRKLALDPQTAAHHVLKPQREGGGNNVYRTAVPPFLKELPKAQWPAYILMEMIETPPARNMILRNGVVSAGGVISELGVFGCCLWQSKGGRGRDVKGKGNVVGNEHGNGKSKASSGEDDTRRGQVGHSSTSEVMVNTTAGYLLRTKGDQSEEGGVAAGFGAVDSCYLI